MLLQKAKQNTAKTASVPAPIGGWNGRDSLANMQPMDAVQMVNWYPTPTDVTMRKGYTKSSTGITGAVNTLMNYPTTSGYKLFADAGTKIWDATSSTATQSYAGITNNELQYVNISNVAGNFLVTCNGTDPVTIYDGTNWFSVATTTTAATISSIARTSPSAISTVTTATAHGLVTNNRVTISGASESTFNGTFVITVTGANTFTYISTGTSTVTSVTGSYTTIGITGANSNTFINVNLFKNRLILRTKTLLLVGICQ